MLVVLLQKWMSLEIGQFVMTLLVLQKIGEIMKFTMQNFKYRVIICLELTDVPLLEAAELYFIDAVQLDLFDTIEFSDCVFCMLSLSGSKLIVGVCYRSPTIVHLRMTKH